ncbi:MAG: hypothetical protein HGB22_03565 [Chlorobiaceae bacterium]|nr:hypothetical protein [Chlorobiaceae bacterium]
MKKFISTIALMSMTALMVPGHSSVVLAKSAKVTKKIERPYRLGNFIGKKRLESYKAVPVRPLNYKDAWDVLSRLQARSHENVAFENSQNLTGGRYVFTSESDRSATFDIDAATGSFLWNFGLKKYTHEHPTLNLPTADQAPAVARKRLAETGYLPANERELVVTHVGGLDMGVAKYGFNPLTFKKLVTVQFGRVLNGLPVQGPGSRIVVSLGEDGALAGLIRNWPEVTSAKIASNKLKSNPAIRKEIRLQLRKEAGDAVSTSIRNASLVLFDDGRGVIEPAVYVVADARYTGPRNETLVNNPVDFYVPVLKKPEAYYPYMKSRNANAPGFDDRKTTK